MARSTPPLLTAQHAELRALALRLKEAATGRGSGRPALEKALGGFLPRLFQHETDEQPALGAAAAGRGDGAELLRRLSADHLSLRALAKDVLLVETHCDEYGHAHLARLSGTLADALLAHLEREEKLFR